MGRTPVVLPGISLATVAGAWLGPLTRDQRAAVLTAAAVASTFAALQPRPRQRVQAVGPTPAFRGEPIDDLEAVIAAW